MSCIVRGVLRHRIGRVMVCALACLPACAWAQAAQLVGTRADVTQAAPGGYASDPAHEDALRCLTLAVAYEAGNQSRAGQEAVAEVVMNRLGKSVV